MLPWSAVGPILIWERVINHAVSSCVGRSSVQQGGSGREKTPEKVNKSQAFYSLASISQKTRSRLVVAMLVDICTFSFSQK